MIPNGYRTDPEELRSGIFVLISAMVPPLFVIKLDINIKFLLKNLEDIDIFPTFAHGNKTMVVHPGEQRLLLGHQVGHFLCLQMRVTTRVKILAVAIP